MTCEKTVGRISFGAVDVVVLLESFDLLSVIDACPFDA